MVGRYTLREAIGSNATGDESSARSSQRLRSLSRGLRAPSLQTQTLGVRAYVKRISPKNSTAWLSFSLVGCPNVRNGPSHHRGGGRAKRARKETREDDRRHVLSSARLWIRQRLAGRLWAGTHSAVIRCIRRHPIALTMYIGCLPNSSLKELVTSGTSANPRVYMDIPMVAMMFVERKS